MPRFVHTRTGRINLDYVTEIKEVPMADGRFIDNLFAFTTNGKRHHLYFGEDLLTADVIPNNNHNLEVWVYEPLEEEGAFDDRVYVRVLPIVGWCVDYGEEGIEAKPVSTTAFSHYSSLVFIHDSKNKNFTTLLDGVTFDESEIVQQVECGLKEYWDWKKTRGLKND